MTIRDDAQMRLWYKGDDTFAVPKASVMCRIDTPVVRTAQDRALAELFVDMLLDSVQEALYPAKEAGISYDLYVASTGLVFDVSGFNHRIPKFVSFFIQNLFAAWSGKLFRKDRFAILQQLYLMDLRNFNKKQPYSHAFAYIDHMALKPNYLPSELLAASTSLTLDQLHAFGQAMFTGPTFVECLVHGNMNKDEAIELSKSFVFNSPPYPLSERQAHRIRALEFPAGVDSFFVIKGPNTADTNSAVINKYQIGGVKDDAQRMSLALLEDVLSDEAFNFLRTKQQLGYIVQLGSENLHGALALTLLVQGSKKGPAFVDGQIEAFFQRYRQLVHDISDEKMAAFKKSRNDALAAPFRRLGEETEAYWVEVSKGRYQFNRSAVDIQALSQVRASDLVEIMDTFVVPPSQTTSQRRKASMQVRERTFQPASLHIHCGA